MECSVCKKQCLYGWLIGDFDKRLPGWICSDLKCDGRITSLLKREIYQDDTSLPNWEKRAKERDAVIKKWL